MPKAADFNDEEMRDFIDHLPRHLTFTEMAAACLERFGSERAWSRTKIVRYWDAAYPVRKGYPSRVSMDIEVREFIDDRLGRMTLDTLVAACVERFGQVRTPGRSSIHLYWQKVRRSRGAKAKR